MAGPAHQIEVVARHHAAIADEDHAPEPEALLQITEDFGNRVVVAPIAFGGNNIEKNFPRQHRPSSIRLE